MFSPIFINLQNAKILAAFTSRRCSEQMPPTKHRHSSRSKNVRFRLTRRALFRFRKFRFFARSHDRGAVFVQQRRQSPRISRKTEEIIYARMRIHNDLNAFHAALRIGLYESFLFHFFLRSQHYFKGHRAFAALAVAFIITRMCVFCNCRCYRAKRAPLLRLPISD